MVVIDTRELRCGPAAAIGWRGAAVLLLLATLGCMSIGPVYSMGESQETGPFPEDYIEITYAWVENDFSTITRIRSLDMTTPVPGVAKEFLGREQIHGWYSKVELRGSDGSGALTGRLYYAVLINGKKVVASRKLVR